MVFSLDLAPKMDQRQIAHAARQQLESLERAGLIDLKQGDRSLLLGLAEGQTAVSTAKSTPATEGAVAGMSGTGSVRTEAAAKKLPVSDSSLSSSGSATNLNRTSANRAAGEISSSDLGDYKLNPKDLPPTYPKNQDGTPESTMAKKTSENLAAVSRIRSLGGLQKIVASCTACHELATTRQQTVFGVGDPNARVVFMGEAPGATEDEQGEPFVGRAGQLLTKIIEACGFKREDIYILNTLKCRPPGNRNPKPEEVIQCRPFFDKQIALINPEIICCLGAVASQNLLKTEVPIGKLRGKFHELDGRKVLCTYHPAYLLRNPPAKKYVWEDMKFMMRELGIEL